MSHLVAVYEPERDVYVFEDASVTEPDTATYFRAAESPTGAAYMALERLLGDSPLAGELAWYEHAGGCSDYTAVEASGLDLVERVGRALRSHGVRLDVRAP